MLCLYLVAVCVWWVCLVCGVGVRVCVCGVCVFLVCAVCKLNVCFLCGGLCVCRLVLRVCGVCARVC